MLRISPIILALTQLSCILVLAEQKSKKSYVGMQKFLTRPDIECASWKVTVYDEYAVAPGYWFVAPYEKNGYKRPGGSWIGPHIYDRNGELVWSGSQLFNNINVMDFGIVDVAGKELLSMSYAVEGNGYILDNRYKVKQTVSEGVTGVTYDMHDFHTVDHGTRFLYLQRNFTHASREISRQDLGFDGECSVTFPGFEERDVETGEVLFKWDATGIIPLSDSTSAFNRVEDRCTGGSWDYLHSNAIDKFPDGHYLLSSRHSNTIYKISKDDGSIIWRLDGRGGERSDFEMGNLNFSRQHHARIREQNETHTIISFLDNSVGADPQPATTQWSRGLLVALREDTMKAEIIASYDHPHRGRTFRRGSYQTLPNGNVFMGWSEHGLQSEHTQDGKLIMEAELIERKLGTYRAFKFPFVASPDYPPDIYSNASSSGNKTTTSVYVSWNGATEVASWTLYKTDISREGMVKLKSVPRTGFETSIHYDGFAKYVFVQARDHNGKTLRNSAVIEPLLSDELLSIQLGSDERDWTDDMLINPIAMFILGIACSAMVALPLRFVVRRSLQWWHSRGRLRYERVPINDIGESHEMGLEDLSRFRSYRDELEDNGKLQG